MKAAKKRARGRCLKTLPHHIPVYAVSPAGLGRWRWAVWSRREHLGVDGSVRDGELLTLREPDAGGFGYSPAEAEALALACSPLAVRAGAWYASLGYLCRYRLRDRLLAEAEAAGVDPRDLVLARSARMARHFSTHHAQTEKRDVAEGNVVHLNRWLAVRAYAAKQAAASEVQR